MSVRPVRLPTKHGHPQSKKRNIKQNNELTAMILVVMGNPGICSEGNELFRKYAILKYFTYNLQVNLFVQSRTFKICKYFGKQKCYANGACGQAG